MAKRFVLSGYFGFKNFGDEEILSVLIHKLKQNNHMITVISSDPKYTKNQYKHIRSVYTFDIKNIAFLIAKSDILISGGGSLLQDATSLKSLLYYLFIIFLAFIFNKKVIIFAQGIGPINNPIGKFLTKSLLKYAKYVSVRDENSLDLLSSWGINADLVCDPIFCSNVQNDTKTNTLAVQLREFRTLNEDFIDRLAQKVCENFSDKTVEIYPFQNSIDYNVCKKFEKAINMLNPNIKTILYRNLSNDEIISKLSKAQYLIGMRFHSIIIGLLAKCKVLTINYDIKVEKISKEFNLPMLDLKKDFHNQFDELKKQNSDRIFEKVKEKEFDWSGFENAIQS